MPQSRQPRGKASFHALLGLVLVDILEVLPEGADALVGLEPGVSRGFEGRCRPHVFFLAAQGIAGELAPRRVQGRLVLVVLTLAVVVHAPELLADRVALLADRLELADDR